jgi:hypothetical protein
MALGYAANSRIARHLGNFTFVQGQQENPTPYSCSGKGGFTPRVPATYNNNVIDQCHNAFKTLREGEP